MRHPSLAASKIRPDFLIVPLVAALSLVASAPAQATRGIPIDVNWFEVWGDASNGDIIPLSFPVNYGAGMQSKVTMTVPDTFDTNGFADVGLNFLNSPSDSLFATIGPSDPFAEQVPAVFISNALHMSTPEQRVANASDFNFGIMDATMSPPYVCPTNSTCETYGPFAGGAEFQFTNLASSGTVGDFELTLICSAFPCSNIGFSLAGDNFSAGTFDALHPPSNMVQFSDNNGVRTWTFLFRNPNSVPEPNTWASMLLGFGLIGIALGRKRSRRLAS